MTVENADVVDVVGVSLATGRVVLTISDHLDWADLPLHADALEQKIRAYLAFVKSRQLHERYPDADSRGIEIQVVLKFAPTPAAERLLADSKQALFAHGIEFSVHTLDDLLETEN